MTGTGADEIGTDAASVTRTASTSCDVKGRVVVGMTSSTVSLTACEAIGVLRAPMFGGMMASGGREISGGMPI